MLNFYNLTVNKFKMFLSPGSNQWSNNKKRKYKELLSF